MGLLRGARLGGFLVFCSVVLAASGTAMAENPVVQGAPPTGFAFRSGNHGPDCQRVRMQSPPYSNPGGNDMVLYCPLDFPWIMHCGTTGAEAPLDGTSLDEKPKCTESGPCSARKLRRNFGPQNQATEIVQKNVSSTPGILTAECAHPPKIVTGCWVYDLDHVHLPYTTEIICCRSGVR